MTKQFVRWWVAFIIIFTALLTTLLAGVGDFILNSDCTYLSWIIFGVFITGSIHLGRNAQRWNLNPDNGLTKYFIDTCTSLGLLGTVIGLIIMIVGTFSNLDVTDHASIKQSLIAMSSGIGTALVTTLVGIVSSILLKFQLVIVTGGKNVQ